MRLDQETLKLLCIISSIGKPYQWKMAVSTFAVWITPFVFILPSIAYFITHILDVVEATSAFYMICITGMATLVYSEYWLKRPIILSIIKQIQAIVNDSSREFQPFYEKTELIVDRVVFFYKTFLYCSVFGVVSLPISVYMAMWMIGMDPSSMKILPASME